jgi:dolichol-phosphate mannosyltransferase
VIRALSGTHAQSDAGDYRMMSRATVEAVNALPEHNRVLRFIVPALGFPSASVSYRRDERAAGRSKYPLAKMVRLSIDSVTGFSIAPLRAATWLGLTGGLAAVGLLLYALVAQTLGHTLPGWTSTVVAVSAVGAVQLLCLGILGEYVGRMYAMMQARPTYFIAYDSLTGPATTADEALPAGPATTGAASRPDAPASPAGQEPAAAPAATDDAPSRAASRQASV